MAKQVVDPEIRTNRNGAVILTTSKGEAVTVAILDNDAIRVRFASPRKTAVTWHATGTGKQSITVITPEQE